LYRHAILHGYGGLASQAGGFRYLNQTCNSKRMVFRDTFSGCGLADGFFGYVFLDGFFGMRFLGGVSGCICRDTFWMRFPMV
jgi:hypothetical protein